MFAAAQPNRMAMQSSHSFIVTHVCAVSSFALEAVLHDAITFTM